MNEPFVARIPIKYGPPNSKDHVFLYPGDELPKEMTDAQVLELRQSGSAVPKSVWEALHAAENAIERAREAQRAAEDEVTQ